MFSGYSGYWDPKYKPTGDDLVCTFRITPAKGIKFRMAAESVAGESSVGTWTEVKTSTARIRNTLAPKVFWTDEKKGLAKVAYPSDLFEPGNAPQILSSIAGNIFSVKIIDGLRLEHFDLPKVIAQKFKGPAHGIPGIRKFFKQPKRPLCGTIVKPKLGLTAKEHAEVAYQCWTGGLDYVKDDENLTSQPFNKFEERVIRVLDMRDKAQEQTGEKKLAILNVTAPASEMMRRAQFVKDHGGELAMIDIITAGYGCLQELRNTGMILHGHRAMHAAFTRNPLHGVDFSAMAMLARFSGIDQLHVGSFNVGKMAEGGEGGDERSQKELERPLFGFKPAMTVCSGGLHPGMVQQLVAKAGMDIVIQGGGGVHGHPRGSHYGAMAMRQAVEGTAKGIPLAKYAQSHKELQEAIKQWGYTDVHGNTAYIA